MARSGRSLLITNMVRAPAGGAREQNAARRAGPLDSNTAQVRPSNDGMVHGLPYRTVRRRAGHDA